RAVHELHADVAEAEVLAILVDPADVAVGHLARELDLVPEATARLLRAAELRAQDLERDVLLEGAVVRLVDDTHAAAAEEGHDLEAVGDHLSLGEREQGPAAGEAALGVVGVTGSARAADHDPP